MANDKLITTIFRWTIIIAMPFFLAILVMRLVIAWDSPSYPEFEYGRIPPDRYGFTLQERLERAEVTLDYLRQSEPAEDVIFMLEELTLPSSSDPLYNEEEISHMIDVKNVADNFKLLGLVLGILIISDLTFLLLRPQTRREGYRALFHSGLFTAVLLLVIGLLVALAWNFVFVQFHELLFPPGTWTFAYTDSLIRLFPEQFWFDFGLLWVSGIFIMGLLIMALGYLLLRRSGENEGIIKV